MASGYFRTSYAQDLALITTRFQAAWLAVFLVLLLAFPLIASPFQLDLACQVFLASIGALALMLLTGYAGQISLGHAGLIAAGAFTAGILFRELNAPFWVTLPAAGLVGALLGVIFGLPSLRLRGLYLAVSTLALHFMVIYAGGEYESRRGFSTGIVIDPPQLGTLVISDGRAWYFILLIAAAATLLICINLLRSRTGRAWRAIRTHETVAEALGIGIAGYKLLAFVLSSVITADRRRAVRLLSRFRLGRGIFAVPGHPIRRHGHCRRHGLAPGRAPWGGFRHGLSLSHRERVACASFRATLCRPALCSELRRVRAGDDSVPPLRAARPRRHLASRIQNYFLLWPYKHRGAPGTRT